MMTVPDDGQTLGQLIAKSGQIWTPTEGVGKSGCPQNLCSSQGWRAASSLKSQSSIGSQGRLRIRRLNSALQPVSSDSE